MSDKPDYRPKSPDLSAFAPPPPPPHLTRLPSYHQDPGPPTGYSIHHRGSYDASPYFSPATAQSTSYFGSQPHAESQVDSPQTYQPQSSTPFGRTVVSRHSLPSQRVPQSFSPQHNYRQSPAHSFAHPPPTFSQPQYETSPSTMARPRRRKSSDEDQDSDDAYTPNSLAPGRTSKKRKSDTMASETSMAAPTPSNPFQGVEVKTKFPVARIKRIMQADEDVGKVAQATPTAVSKALELFMIQLVQKGAAEARARNSKKVTAAHLKSALLQDQQFDFVWGICEKVPDPGEKKRGGGVKSEGEGDDSSDQNGAAKRQKVKRRGTKVADDSD